METRGKKRKEKHEKEKQEQKKQEQEKKHWWENEVENERKREHYSRIALFLTRHFPQHWTTKEDGQFSPFGIALFKLFDISIVDYTYSAEIRVFVSLTQQTLYLRLSHNFCFGDRFYGQLGADKGFFSLDTNYFHHTQITCIMGPNMRQLFHVIQSELENKRKINRQMDLWNQFETCLFEFLFASAIVCDERNEKTSPIFFSPFYSKEKQQLICLPEYQQYQEMERNFLMEEFFRTIFPKPLVSFLLLFGELSKNAWNMNEKWEITLYSFTSTSQSISGPSTLQSISGPSTLQSISGPSSE